MKIRAHWPALIGGAIVITGALLLNWFSKIGFLAALAISAYALIINGIIAAVEDELPGGFNNPKGTKDEKHH